MPRRGRANEHDQRGRPRGGAHVGRRPHRAGAGGQPAGLAAVRGVRARQARPQPRARRLAARPRRRDGGARRPRPLHPAQRGREHLGRQGRPHHRVQPRREGPDVRPERRRGLPPPDVLRDPRRRPPHVSGVDSCGSPGRIHSKERWMAHEETVYDALDHAHGGEGQWAFGTGFDEPLAGVDTTVPDGIDPADLGAYCLMLGDDALVLAQRLTQWVTASPELEEEVAIANTALDLLGQARLLLARAGSVGVLGRSREHATASIPDEDALAYFRDPDEFRNTALVEAPNGDFAQTMVRLLAAAAVRLAVFARLRESRDPVLAAIAAKGVNELAYHRDHAARWVVRLGDGTEQSHRRAQAGADAGWPLLADVFTATDVERRLTGVAVDPAEVRQEVCEVLTTVLVRATLTVPEWPADASPRGRNGEHTPELTELLGTLQGLAREHPAATW